MSETQILGGRKLKLFFRNAELHPQKPLFEFRVPFILEINGNFGVIQLRQDVTKIAAPCHPQNLFAFALSVNPNLRRVKTQIGLSKRGTAVLDQSSHCNCLWPQSLKLAMDAGHRHQTELEHQCFVKTPQTGLHYSMMNFFG